MKGYSRSDSNQILSYGTSRICGIAEENFDNEDDFNETIICLQDNSKERAACESFKDDSKDAATDECIDISDDTEDTTPLSSEGVNISRNVLDDTINGVNDNNEVKFKTLTSKIIIITLTHAKASSARLITKSRLVKVALFPLLKMALNMFPWIVLLKMMSFSYR